MIHLAVNGCHEICPCCNMVLERIPDVGPLLDILDICIKCGNLGVNGVQSGLQLAQLLPPKLIQLIWK